MSANPLTVQPIPSLKITAGRDDEITLEVRGQGVQIRAWRESGCLRPRHGWSARRYCSTADLAELAES